MKIDKSLISGSTTLLILVPAEPGGDVWLPDDHGAGPALGPYL